MNDDLMQRREVLRRVAWMLGGAVSVPAALAVLQGCSAKDSSVSAAAPKFLTAPAHMDIVTEIVDIIIPKTDTSGAKDAGVPAFIDSVLAAVYPKDAQERFIAGLREFAAAASTSGKPFLEREPAQRVALVKQSIETALGGERNPKPFILMARELTLLGFFTSRVGITENMEYVAVPTAYHGCVPLSELKKHVYWE
ncbi:MAG TPA: gluconate 2-dehydrogenase subunit 3 family protein [Steroidobacteraceae bacterium]|nr:gluconate 2-dehydrogenase subunit 3 family protein [Steroidobacteraceae bacterium]